MLSHYGNSLSKNREQTIWGPIFSFDYPMYPMSGLQLLAKRGYIVVREHRSIKSVYSFPRRKCGMGSACGISPMLWTEEQKTCVWPLNSATIRCNARELDRLTEPMGPGAGWHLYIAGEKRRSAKMTRRNHIRQMSISL
jgi:hypothetical protein